MKPRIRAAFLALIAAQAVHSVEEYVFRLYDLLAPARFVADSLGVARPLGFAISNSLLVGFGLWCWFARVGPGRGAARFLAWAWALLELANGLGHIALAVAARGYFPGLGTAPLLIAVSAWLIAALRHARR
jgi:hypothetical protein